LELQKDTEQQQRHRAGNELQEFLSLESVSKMIEVLTWGGLSNGVGILPMLTYR